MKDLTLLLYSIIFFTLTACGGGGGDSSGGDSGGGSNTAPTVNAGADQTIEIGSLVQLSGSGNDAEGAVSFEWGQTAGTTVTLSNVAIANPTFTATEAGDFEFRLTVTDTNSSSVIDTVVITINDASGGGGNTYLFYLESEFELNLSGTSSTISYNNSLYAVDPENPASPILVEAVGNLLANSNDAGVSSVVNPIFNNTKDVITDTRLYAVIYPKTDGRLYRVSALTSETLSPVQVSNESEADQMCSAFSSGAPVSGDTPVENSQYVYSLHGLDAICDTEDDVWKMVKLGMNSSEPPVAAKKPVLSFSNQNTSTLLGWLVHDDSALRQCDNNFGNCRLITTVIDSVYHMQRFDEKYNLLQIDEQLFSYNSETEALSSPIYTIPSGELVLSAYNDGNKAYFGSGSSVYEFPLDGSAMATILTSEVDDIQNIVGVGVNNIVYITGVDFLGKEIKSIPKGGGSSISLVTATGTDDLSIVGIKNKNIYYNIYSRNDSEEAIAAIISTPVAAGIIDETGTVISETANAGWVGLSFASTYDIATLFPIDPVETFFLAEGYDLPATSGGFAGATLKSVDSTSAATRKILGVFETTDKLLDIACFGNPNGSHDLLCNVIVEIEPTPELPALPIRGEVYYLNTVTDNSLTRVTETTVNNISIVY